MISLTAHEAFLAYEAVRHRLPRALPPNGGYRQAQTLEEISDLFDAFLLDAFGVLNIGETAIPGVIGRVESLKARGKRVMVVSNAASVPHQALVAKYQRLGFDFAPEDIVTSRATMTARMNVDAGQNWGVMLGADAHLNDLAPLRMTVLGDDPLTYDAVDGFLLIGSGTWTEARQAMLECSLCDRKRRVLVANPDIVAPREDGFSAEPGHFAHKLADRTNVVPEFFGKPFSNIFDLALTRLGPLRKDRVVMVGDTLHTDILGAQSAGISSALIASYGFFADEDVRRAIEVAGIVPDFLVDRP